MNLRQKLLSTFGGLGLLALVTAGVTVWAIARWQESENQIQSHYQRSLFLQRVRAATFRAFKEVPDALIGGDANAKEEFEKSLEPVEQDFQRWAELAHDEAERKQVQQVRNAYEVLVRDAREAFELIAAKRNEEAFQYIESELDKDFLPFQQLTEAAVESDQNYRRVIWAQARDTRQTAQTALAIAAFGTLSVVLLLFAYLTSDLFAPLREVEEGLDGVALGDLQRRLDEERDDELGRVNRAFNRMAEAMQEREQVMGLLSVPSEMRDETSNGLKNMPARLTLHRLVSQLRSRLSRAGESEANGNGATATQQQQEIVAELDDLLHAVARVTEFGFPLDLNLARTDMRALVYDVVLRFHEEFARRGISFELEIAPEVDFALVDRLKLREALAELVRNAIASLPERGGQLGIRAAIAADGEEVLVEVADSGKGFEQSLDDRAARIGGVGLKLTRAIVEQHGGHLAIDSEPGEGTCVQVTLPLRE